MRRNARSWTGALRVRDSATSESNGPRPNAAVRASLSDDIYIELIRLLLSALLGSIIIGVVFIGMAIMIWRGSPDPLIGALGIAGAIISAARAGFLAVFRIRHPQGLSTVAEAARWERNYAGLSFAFATIVGVFGATVLTMGPTATHMLVVGLLFAYCSGIVARISIRSWIAIPCVLLSAVPMIAAAAVHPEFEYRVFSVFIALLVIGGIESARYVSRAATNQIKLQREFAAMARHDDLTGLANRLSLRMHFETVTTGAGNRKGVAIHCIDLDRFKPVNDRYGHPVGDILLQEIAGRLRQLLRADDLAVRLGGDEFVVLQTNVEHADQADMLARRIQRDICLPYMIEGQQIEIGTSVGYALSPSDGRSLEQLIACADDALYRIKRRGGGIASCSDLSVDGLDRVAV